MDFLQVSQTPNKKGKAVYLIIHKTTGWYYAGDGHWVRRKTEARVYSRDNAADIILGLAHLRHPQPAFTLRYW
jgi:hypothetical protein